MRHGDHHLGSETDTQVVSVTGKSGTSRDMDSLESFEEEESLGIPGR